MESRQGGTQRDKEKRIWIRSSQRNRTKGGRSQWIVAERGGAYITNQITMVITATYNLLSSVFFTKLTSPNAPRPNSLTFSYISLDLTIGGVESNVPEKHHSLIRGPLGTMIVIGTNVGIIGMTFKLLLLFGLLLLLLLSGEEKKAFEPLVTGVNSGLFILPLMVALPVIGVPNERNEFSRVVAPPTPLTPGCDIRFVRFK